MTKDPILCPRCGAAAGRFSGHCVHCGAHVSADTAKEWKMAVRAPCPRCGRPW